MPMNVQQRIQGGLAVGGIQVGDGTALKAVTVYAAPIPVSNVGPNSGAVSTVTATGVKAGDIVVGFQPPAVAGNLKPTTARVSAADTIEVTWVNLTAGTLSFTSSGVNADFVVARRFE